MATSTQFTDQAATPRTGVADEAVRQQVVIALHQDGCVGGLPIEVGVTNGVVTLHGVVPQYAHRLIAHAVTCAVPGVQDIVDELEIHHFVGRFPADIEITWRVPLVLQWDALAPSKDIEFTVAGGWVTLRGQVPTSEDRAQAERVVGYLDGVRGIINNIQLAAGLK